jgi:hypothetical protein
MRTTTKTIGAMILALAISFCVDTSVNAQTPNDDPGIGGPGSDGNAPGDDGGPIVPLDRGMSLVLAASGIAYATKKVRCLAATKVYL